MIIAFNTQNAPDMNSNDYDNEIFGWNAKSEIAEKVVPILKSYRELIKSDQSYAIPTWINIDQKKLTEAEMKTVWLSYLDQMILAFSLENSGKVLTAKDRNEQKKGLDLFAKYYCHLWD